MSSLLIKGSFDEVVLAEEVLMAENPWNREELLHCEEFSDGIFVSSLDSPAEINVPLLVLELLDKLFSDKLYLGLLVSFPDFQELLP